MIYHTTPHILLQNFTCLDVGQKKTGLAHNFNNNKIAFAWKVISTESVLDEISKHNCKVIVGLPTAYPESQSFIFIVEFVNFLQEHLPSYDFIFWDETDSSDIIRKSYKQGRAGFSKNFHNNYDAKSASVILSDFISCNF
ncbi:MAG: Holliday junction resolvase RuvX [Proteobacteria bacterium]|nr:Holliday junction resolvase RuvX [Pseudomonadota bacterium]